MNAPTLPDERTRMDDQHGETHSKETRVTFDPALLRVNGCAGGTSLRRPQRVGCAGETASDAPSDPDGNSATVGTAALPLLGINYRMDSCPGFTGKGAEQSIRPRTIRQLMQQDADQIIIPLFQRKYCWSHAQGTKWFIDLRAPVKRNGWNGCHNTGKAIFKRCAVLGDGAADRGLICVDGQQRLTTTSVLLMSLWECGTRLGLAAFASEVDALLWVRPPGDVVSLVDSQAWRLVPSRADRSTYQELLLALRPPPDPTACFSNKKRAASQENSELKQMKRLMDVLVAECLRESEDPLVLLQQILHQAVDEMYIVTVEILNEVDLSAVFLWLQEKALLGMGSLLQNLAPGIAFHASDLVRNVLMAPFMQRYGVGAPELEEVHVRLWLNPIEQVASCADRLDEWIDQVVRDWYTERGLAEDCEREKTPVDENSSTQAPPRRERHRGPQIPKRMHVSDFEKRICQTVDWFRSCGVLQHDTTGILRYAKFVTFAEEFQACFLDGNNVSGQQVSNADLFVMIAESILARFSQVALCETI